MDTASGLVYHVARQVDRYGLPIVIAAFSLLAMALVGAALIVGLLPPAPEPIINAPIRW